MIRTAKEWLHWKLLTFDNFVAAVLPREGLDKLEVLANLVSPAIFQNMKQSLEYYKLFLWSEEKRYLPVIFLTHGAGSLIWTLDESAPSSFFGNSQQGL